MSDAARRQLIESARQRMRERGRQGLRRRAPRPRRPEQQIRQYQAALRRVTVAIEEEVRERVFPAIDALMGEAGTRQDDVRTDNWAQRLQDLMQSTRNSIQPVIGRTQEMMLSLGDEVEDRATSEQVRAIRAVLGVSPNFYDDDRVRGILDAWKTQNEAFITRMAEDEIEAIQDAASRAIRSGRPNREVRADIRKRFEISDRRARTIARTEISQLNAQITRERQREVGIDGYYWVTSGDERTRDEHEERDGDFFEWDSPPEDGNPGEPVNCRCTARPAVDRLLEQLESDA